MSFSSPQAPSAARLPTALQAAAGARPHATFLATLILALLLRLLGRPEPAWIMPPTAETDRTPHTRAIYAPAIGRAPHAAVIEAGLVPDWILPGIRNRGMRPAAISPRPPRITRPARAPPDAAPVPS